MKGFSPRSKSSRKKPNGVIRKIYRRLLSFYGPQGWWPVTPAGGVAPAYHPGEFPSLLEKGKLEVAVGAILTQNTAWSNAQKAIENLNRAGAMSLERLKHLPLAVLKRLVRPSGFYVQKARKLKDFVRHAVRRGGNLGKWLSGPLAEIRGDLLGIRGVGPETADSILLYAGNRNVFVVDAYTVRISQRLGLIREQDYHPVQKLFQENLPVSWKIYQEFHALFVAHAKQFCLKNPLCSGCPLVGMCPYGKQQKQKKQGKQREESS